MKTETVRAFLAVLVVGVFMLITGVMAIFPLFSKGNVEMDQYANFFSKTASVYTGIVGVIVGYYFGRSDKTSGVPRQEDETPGSQARPSTGA
jgi:uncharacterized membrane protein HdeD (DUF308 family)